MTLRAKLNRIIKEYIRQFENKHEVELDHVVADDLTGIICFGDIYYFHISDIIYDIDHNLPNGLILQWISDCVEYEESNRKMSINLQSYHKGLRHKDLPRDNDGWTTEKPDNVKSYDCFVHTDKGNIYTFSHYVRLFSISEMEKITHYKPIELPKKPFFE